MKKSTLNDSVKFPSLDDFLNGNLKDISIKIIGFEKKAIDGTLVINYNSI